MKKVIIAEQKELIRLLNEWDPIGILPFEGGPKDEYDCFVQPIISILHKNGDRVALTLALNKHLTEHIGLKSKRGYSENFADKIMLWWNQKDK